MIYPIVGTRVSAAMIFDIDRDYGLMDMIGRAILMVLTIETCTPAHREMPMVHAHMLKEKCHGVLSV